MNDNEFIGKVKSDRDNALRKAAAHREMPSLVVKAREGDKSPGLKEEIKKRIEELGLPPIVAKSAQSLLNSGNYRDLGSYLKPYLNQ